MRSSQRAGERWTGDGRDGGLKALFQGCEADPLSEATRALRHGAELRAKAQNWDTGKDSRQKTPSWTTPTRARENMERLRVSGAVDQNEGKERKKRKYLFSQGGGEGVGR